MSDCMSFPVTPEEFIKNYSFVDKEQVYTNGTVLVPVFRVEQMMEHYFPKWIPVTERLPEDNTWVLVALGNRVLLVDQIRNGEWAITRCDFVIHGVTHWMPLPEPPKEKGKSIRLLSAEDDAAWL